MNYLQQHIANFNPSEMAPGQLTTLDAMLLGDIYVKAQSLEKSFDEANLKGSARKIENFR